MHDIAPNRSAEAVADAIISAQDAVVAACSKSTPPRFLITTAAHLAIAASQLDLADGHRSLRIVELWLDAYGFALRADPSERQHAVALARGALCAQTSLLQAGFWLDHGMESVAAVDSDDLVSDLKMWISEHSFSTHTGDSLTTVQEDALMGQHPSSYIGCSITAIGFDDVVRNEQACDEISDVLAESNIVSYLPIRIDSPRLGAAWSDRPDSRLCDEVQVASSSLTVILLSQTAAGLGSLAEMSARHQVPILIVTDCARVTPMISGLTDLVTIVPLDGDLSATVRDYVRRNWPSLVAHARTLRANRRRWSDEIDRFVDGLSALSDEAILAAPTVRMSRRRFHTLLAHDVLWGGATHDEMSQLRSLVHTRPPRIRQAPPRELPRDLLKVLIRAEVECGWTAADSAKLEAIALDALSSNVSQRLNPKQLAYWIDLFERYVD